MGLRPLHNNVGCIYCIMHYLEVNEEETKTKSQTHKPFQVVVLEPHVGILGVSFSHDAVPQFSGLLHVLAVKCLTRKRKHLYDKHNNSCIQVVSENAFTLHLITKRLKVIFTSDSTVTQTCL